MLLAFLLPVALLFPVRSMRSSAALRSAALALVLGLVSVGLARVTTRAVCRTKKLSYYSRVGFTFLWRLPFLNRVSEPERTAVFDRAAAKARTEDARRVIALLRDMAKRGTPLGPDTILEPTRELLTTPGTTKGRAQRVDFALNETARAFLSPPSPALWAAVKTDLATAGATRLSSATAFLFGTTAYFFNNRRRCQRRRVSEPFANTRLLICTRSVTPTVIYAGGISSR